MEGSSKRSKNKCSVVEKSELGKLCAAYKGYESREEKERWDQSYRSMLNQK